MKVSRQIFEDVKSDPGFMLWFETSEGMISSVLTLKECLASLPDVMKSSGAVRICLSHVMMEHRFDFAKVAILGEDEQFLTDVGLHRQPVPIIRAVYDGLVAAREGRRETKSVSDLLQPKGWDARRVMYNLSTKMPLDKDMGINFGPLVGKKPHIEIRVDNGRYEDLAKLLIRYGSLIKIACDPEAYHEEYLKKVKHFVESQQQPKYDIHKIWVFLQPIMSRPTREMLTRIDSHQKTGGRHPDAEFMFLAVLRSALDMNHASDMRVRQGLKMLLSGMGLTIDDLVRALRHNDRLRRYGVMRANEPFTHTQAMLHNTVKTLNMPVVKLTLMQTAMQRARLHQERLIEDEQRKRRTKRQILEQEIQRRKDEKKKLKAAQLAKQRLQHVDDDEDELRQ